MRFIVVVALGFLTLSGCQSVATEVVVPGVESAPPTVLLGHVPGGLPPGFLDQVRDVAADLVVNYLTRSENITADGGANPERIQGTVAPEWWPAEREGFEYFVVNNLRTVGVSEVSRVLVQSARITPTNTVEVGVIACVDSTQVFVLPALSPDPPDAVWEWHPHYEDFDGDLESWEAIETFLGNSLISWGELRAVVYWFEGPTLDSLLLEASEVWWGVYPCG